MDFILMLGMLLLPANAAVHESLQSLPRGWSESGTTLSKGDQIQLSVHLYDAPPIQIDSPLLKVFRNFQNLEKLEPLLQQVSEPTNSKYGSYLDLNSLNSMFQPSQEAVENVTTWLQQSGAGTISQKHGSLSFGISVDNANTMLDTSFKAYTDGYSHRIGTTRYSVPDDIQHHIDFITPTTYFGSPMVEVATLDELPEAPAQQDLNLDCADFVPLPNSDGVTVNMTAFGPRCLSQLYNTANYSVDRSYNSSIAFSSFSGQSASFSDLAIFEKLFHVSSTNFTILASINNGTTSQDPNEVSQNEANLDVQIIAGLVDGLPIGEYSTGGQGQLVPSIEFPNMTYDYNEPFLEYYSFLLAQADSDLPWVLSNSYADAENTVPREYAQRVCNMIGMLGLRGRSVVHSSGDLGVGDLCENNVPPHQPQFNPQFPSTCPYVTTVGGTQSSNPEIGWNQSSGGFSFYFERAWYQEAAIERYLNTQIPAETREYYSSNNYTNFNGRGFPDVAAHSEYPW